MAIIACDTLEQKIGVKLPMAEIAFVALPFSLALKRKWKNQKENVLIVCGSGKASSELLAYQVKENFGNYLDVVGATNHHSLELYDFSNVDYILTTVPIDIPVPIPIIRTPTFFETSSIHQVNQAITDTRSSRFIEYFHKNMVFWSSSDDKNEILEHMCENAVQNYNIPDDFFHYVMKREEIGRTSFGNLITIAHPIHPIDWDGEPAQLTFLLPMKESGENKMKDSYKAMTKLVNNKHYIELLTKTKNYDEVINILKLVASPEDYEKAVKERENTISTFIGYDTAIPHAKTDAVKTPFVAYAKLSHAMDWDGNGEMVKHIFMIGVPKESGSNLHMRIISELSKNIMRNAWRESFINAASADEALEILKLIEKEVI